MQYIKQVVHTLEKCYALSPLTLNGSAHLLVAAEKHDPCLVFDLNGKLVDTVWEEPGGVMTMVPVPNCDGTFLATHQFYSPNDSANAHLICARKNGMGWDITKVADLPFVHRFDIIPCNGVNYVLACTLKSGHAYKDDWTNPGKLWIGVLGEDPTAPLRLTAFFEGLGHNHGYTRYSENGHAYGIVSCDQGVYKITPGDTPIIESLTDQPASDAVLIDLDGDGQNELLTISPFHGDTVTIWHLEGDKYVPVYKEPEKLPFLHAICGGIVHGRPTVYVGNREGDKLLVGYYYEAETASFVKEEVDSGAGPANCLLFSRDGHPALLASNRETNEIAIYDILP